MARRAMNLHGCAPASRAPFPQIPAFKSGCAASEGRASFVARRAVNLHGCALPHSALPPAAAPPYLLGAQPLRERNPGGRPHFAPRSSYSGGTPGSAFRPRVGRFTSLHPPSCGGSALPYLVHGLCGNGTLEAGLTVPPVFPTAGVPQGVYSPGVGRPPSCGDSAEGGVPVAQHFKEGTVRWT